VVVLEYLNPNCSFDIYPDASSMYAMRAVLEQERKIVSTFSWRLNKAQLKYAMTSHELPLEVKACQLFAQIIRGCEI
jgi:hypothetical protein